MPETEYILHTTSSHPGPPSSKAQRAVVLLSGGLDSTTTLAIALSQGYEVYAISFRYGQTHKVEIEVAQSIAGLYNLRDHKIVDIDLRLFGASALTDQIAIPKGRQAQEIGGGIPITYVPARNTIFLSFALAYAEVLRSEHIFIGVNAVDYSGYPDCRPEYIKAFEQMADLATKAGVEGTSRIRIHAPLISMTKREIIQTGMSLGVDYSRTLTCYDPSNEGAACGECDACILRLRGFAENGLTDPAHYRYRPDTVALLA